MMILVKLKKGIGNIDLFNIKAMLIS